ncbi:hypothetical protein HN51_027507 [Arachis hypogaea]|uniref:Mitochondrial intermembrane space import and assembly protein 40 homolog n=1 Tax=Arachis hypogaea TaxID=3818 RepID=A0A445BMQ8_ARAHY|nr:mitochondrial intermembrane space import and assembly protein 40 homolog [Arachis hypogaea]QHO33890.1 uncharacterized protein DS421_9g262260 [Arachis hypogaea]RYR39965.1 hypothetical protein Ahy_A09g045607 [Arachis hypogaea]
MGLAQSAEAAAHVTQTQIQTQTSTQTSTSNNSNSTSLDSVLAEAAAYGNNDDTEESIEAKAQRALECPCIADLRTGPCGFQFSEAFLCFLKSTAEEKGSDCVSPFVALQSCIKANPNAFSKDVLGEDESEKPESTQEYKILPPQWSREPQSPKSRL